MKDIPKKPSLVTALSNIDRLRYTEQLLHQALNVLRKWLPVIKQEALDPDFCPILPHQRQAMELACKEGEVGAVTKEAFEGLLWYFYFRAEYEEYVVDSVCTDSRIRREERRTFRRFQRLLQWWQDGCWVALRISSLRKKALLLCYADVLLSSELLATIQTLSYIQKVATPQGREELRTAYAFLTLYSLSPRRLPDAFRKKTGTPVGQQHLRSVLSFNEALGSVFASALDVLREGKLQPLYNELEASMREVSRQAMPHRHQHQKQPVYELTESSLPLYEDAPSPLEVAPSAEPDPAEVVADRDAVERTLARFGKRTADLLRLMLEGRSAAEAARELGICEGTAWKLLERARKRFSRAL